MSTLQTMKHIVIHHSASGPVKMETIRRWHTDPKPRGHGWSDIGYQYVIEMDGKRRYGRPLFKRGVHCPPFNQHSLGICIIGDNRPGKHPWTDAQIDTARELVAAIRLLAPRATVVGHKDVGRTRTICPGVSKQRLRELLL